MDFLRLINIIISASTENAKTDMIFFIRVVCMLDTLPYPTYWPAPKINLCMGRASILCLWLAYGTILYHNHKITYIKKIHTHTDHGDKPAATEFRNISANIASFFYLKWAPFSLQTRAFEAMLRSTWEGKTTEFSFPRDCGLRCPTSPNSGDPGKRAGPFLTLLTLVSHSFRLFWRWEEVGVFVGQKKVSSLYFSIFHEELEWNLTFSCHLSQISCKHVTINFERGKRLGKKGRELWAYHQQNQQST